MHASVAKCDGNTCPFLTPQVKFDPWKPENRLDSSKIVRPRQQQQGMWHFYFMLRLACLRLSYFAQLLQVKSWGHLMLHFNWCFEGSCTVPSCPFKLPLGPISSQLCLSCNQNFKFKMRAACLCGAHHKCQR
eukprot:805236-Pelagomonas_calceolata.AAC.2